jgi:hypothetical protein
LDQSHTARPLTPSASTLKRDHFRVFQNVSGPLVRESYAKPRKSVMVFIDRDDVLSSGDRPRCDP